MNTYYKTYFTVSFLHDYFDSGETPDLRVVPLPETTAWMKKHRIGFRPSSKKNATGFKLWYEADSEGEQIFVPTDDVRLGFAIYLNDKRILDITDPAEVPKTTDQISHITNSGATLTSAATRLYRPVFTYTKHIDSASGDVDIEVLDENGSSLSPAVTHTMVWGGAGVEDFSQDIDLSDYPEGRYTVHYPNTEATDEDIYVNNTYKSMGLAGLLEIDVASSYDPSSSPTAFELQFTRRSDEWRYYIVDTSAVGSFAIVDVEAILTITAVGFPQDPDPYTPKIDSLEEAYPGAVVTVFASTTDVDYTETPKAQLELRESGNTIISDLPNPTDHDVIVVV